MRKIEERGLFPGVLEMMILRTLKRQPLHGYALVQHIKHTSNDVLQIERRFALSSPPASSQRGMGAGGVECVFHQSPRSNL